MGKNKKTGLKWAIALLLAAAAALAVWLTCFHNADVLTIQDGAVQGAKPTWLIGRFGEDAPYVKTADVGAPRGYRTVAAAEDSDGDAITNEFVFEGKDPEKNPGTLRIWAAPGTELPEGETAQLGKFTGVLTAAEAGENGQKRQFWIDSPYEDGKIALEAMLDGEASDQDLKALLETGLTQVLPGKKMSPLMADIKLNFLDDDRWTYLTNGLVVTLEITLVAVILGIVIGVLIAAIRSTWDQNNENMHPGAGRTMLSMLNSLCKFYLTVIRGTPVVIQLMIMYYIIFASSRNGVLIAMLAFGINSGAYVAEIIRGGIMSVDRGQLEAGRSLGFNYVKTMWFIIVPQAMKSVLPALANEFIVLLKETSVAGYVAVKDLTKGGDIIRGVTYSAFMPLIAVALIYLVMVMFFTWLVGKLERRLRSSDH